MLRIAFKEWAVICKALAEGRQALILRKGGIAESGGAFKPEYDRFWLYPTYVHQQHDGIKAAAVPLLQSADADHPAAGIIHLQHIAEVSGVYFVRHLEDALSINHLHFWSEETVCKRFAYRQPGLYVLAVRIYRVPLAQVLTESEAYEGCKTWVELDRELSDEGALPVLDSRSYASILEEMECFTAVRLYVEQG